MEKCSLLSMRCLESRSKHPPDLCKQASNSTLGACRCLVVWQKKRRRAYQCQCRNDRGTQNKNLTRAREIEKINGYKINVEAGVPTARCVGVRWSVERTVGARANGYVPVPACLLAVGGGSQLSWSLQGRTYNIRKKGDVENQRERCACWPVELKYVYTSIQSQLHDMQIDITLSVCVLSGTAVVSPRMCKARPREEHTHSLFYHKKLDLQSSALTFFRSNIGYYTSTAAVWRWWFIVGEGKKTQTHSLIVAIAAYQLHPVKTTSLHTVSRANFRLSISVSVFVNKSKLNVSINGRPSSIFLIHFKWKCAFMATHSSVVLATPLKRLVHDTCHIALDASLLKCGVKWYTSSDMQLKNPHNFFLSFFVRFFWRFFLDSSRREIVSKNSRLFSFVLV